MTDWRITFPIEKAEKREDGLFITGLASGPEIDAQGERMDNELIYRFADQINSTGGLALSSRLVYRDAHAPDGVLRDLGWIHKAWVNLNNQLAVEVKLDEENPAAAYLFKQLSKGKQFGMSVAGKVLDYTDDFVVDAGHVVRTYLDVILTEISNTTRPAWTPSFGSVLAKALKDTDDGATAKGADIPALADVKPTGEHMSDAIAVVAEKADTEVPEEPTPTPETPSPEVREDTEQEVVEETPGTTEVPEAEKAAVAVVEADKAKDNAQKDALQDAGTTAVVEPTTPTLSDAEKADLVSRFAEFGKALKAAGLLADEPTIEAAEKTDSEDEGENLTTKAAEETPTEPTPAQPSYEDLARSNAEQAAKIAALEAAPPTQLPPVVERTDTATEDFRKDLSELPREARLRAAFAARTGGQ